MKIRISLLFVTALTFVFAASAQVILDEPNANTDNHIKTTHDAERDITIFETLPYLVDEKTGGCPDLLTVRWAFVHSGKDLERGEYFVTFVCRGSESSFDDQTELSFIADGEMISVGRGDRVADKGTDPEGSSTYEEIVFKVQKGDLNKLAIAAKIDLQIGNVKSEVPTVVGKGLGQLLARTSLDRKKSK